MNTTSVEFSSPSGVKALVDVPAPRDGGSIFVIGGHKTGSTLLQKIVADIAKETGLPAIPVESRVWSQGLAIKDWPRDLYALLERDGYVFYSFRWLQKLPEVRAFGAARKIFLVRDPRDIAVSYYYSMAKSHVIPKGGRSRNQLMGLRKAANILPIDEFILAGHAGPILRNIERFASFLGDERSTFYKYEDVIYEKQEWVKRLCCDLGVTLSGDRIEDIAGRHDIFPEQEDPGAHIRRVAPGGYREKLSDRAIDYIRDQHPVFFAKYGYA